MSLNQVESLRELQLHGIINNLTREVDNLREQNSNIKLKMDNFIHRAEIAERELFDREESLYKLMAKLISSDAKLLAFESERNQNLQFLALMEEVEALRLTIQKKEDEITALKHELGVRVLQNRKVA